MKQRRFSDLGIGQPKLKNMIGNKISLSDVLNIEVEVISFKISPSHKFPQKELLTLQLKVNDQYRILFSSSTGLIDQVNRAKEDDFPFFAKIVKVNGVCEFN